jgi:hypothetical protein
MIQGQGESIDGPNPVTELVTRAPVKLGRTAVMKLAYFLLTAKGVPLGYRTNSFPAQSMSWCRKSHPGT